MGLLGARALSAFFTFLSLAPLLAAQELANAGFEEGAEGAPPVGWTLEHGAGNPNGKPSTVASRAGGAREGERALELAGGADTWSWLLASQELDAEPGWRWTLEFAVKSENVRQEAQQFFNSYIALNFFDANGKLLLREITPPITGTHAWSDLVLQAIVPAGAVKGAVAIFLSMSGALAVDDLRLAAEPTAPFDKRAREAGFDALEGHLRRTYPFFGLAEKPLPDELFDGQRAKAVREKDLEGFAGAIAKMLDELDDLHVFLEVEGERIYTGPKGNPHPTNWNLEAVDARLAEVLSRGENHVVGRLAEGYGYVRIASFVAEWDEIRRVDAAMDELAEVPAWVIDVRPNGGGAEDKAQFLAARFASERTEYARHRFRDPFAPGDPAAFGEIRSRYLVPREGRERDERPVAVLMGPYCVSSTESFLLMMRAAGATLVGRPSRGASANPGRFTVVPGFDVVASRWRDLDLANECIEGVGVEPEVLVDAPPSAYRKADPTFEKALELLAGK